jgi:4-aminobutyrate aminotransferase-like enzyme/Ser/Thr protein kinase RdoA (MazF antagonist)
MSVVQFAPRFTAEDAISVANQHYGLCTTARPLPSERDQNFYLRNDRGEEFVLKIAGGSESQVVLEMQNQAIAHLHEAEPSRFQLRLIPTRDGETMVVLTGLDGRRHWARLFNYLPGAPLAEVKPQTPELLHELGAYLGALDRTLRDFQHPAAERPLQWDLRAAGAVIRRYLDEIDDPARRALVATMLAEGETELSPHLADLRTSVIHNDGNDYNVIITPARLGEARAIAGLIDFGDMLHTYTVSEVAIACAYAMLNKRDPLAAAAQVVAGYHGENPLDEAELAALFALIRLRLCTSVALSAHQQRHNPENDYLSISEQPAWALLQQLREVHPRLAHYRFRQACGLPPCPQTPAIVEWLCHDAGEFWGAVDLDLRTAPVQVVDLSVSSPLVASAVGSNTVEFSERIFTQIAKTGAMIGIGRYNEARLVYTGDQFQTVSEELPEQRTVHLGIDLFLPPGAPVFAPLAGVIHRFANNTTQHDYGPVIVLEHAVKGSGGGRMNESLVFYTLYGHLSEESLAGLAVGMPVQRGEQIGSIGNFPQNGDWPPHLHFQIITDLLDQGTDFDGVAPPSQRELWLSLSPDPNLILQIPPTRFPPIPPSQEETLAVRRQQIGRNLSISYRKPLKIVRGWRQFLYDDVGRAYLDVVNNVCHVGHCHPQVVRAGQEQMAVLNTNTRYLHDYLNEYARRLTATLPEPLSVCFFVNSGSEANDLALRLARTYTGRTDTICLDVAYHGNLTSLVDISPYKFAGPGGRGAPPTTHVALMPDPYRGRYRGMASGPDYARHVSELLAQVEQQGRGVAAFIAESLLGCGGQIVLPDGYLAAVYAAVRAVGGVCIADEVQVGFGRVGSHFWGFETQGVVPDIVTLGKPIGNGHPLGAVVTTPAIADAFANGMEYFNTFGGNPVSCAIGMAVLDVIEQEGLQAHALSVGNRLMDGLRSLMDRHPLIGDVRGLGLFVGVELVLDRTEKTPAGEHAAHIANRMRDHRILISTDGPDHNVLKLKPPLVFDATDADRLVTTLDKVLAEDAVRIE